MPDDVMTPGDDQEEAGPIVHDDIMKRLLDYQRQLREGPDAEGAPPLVDHSRLEAQTATATAEEIVDLTELEQAEPVTELVDIREPEPEVVEITEPEAQVVDITEPQAGVVETAEPEAEVATIAASMDDVAAIVDALPEEAPTSKEEAEPTPATEGAGIAPPAGDQQLAERVERLEASFEKIATMLAAVRSDFQDLAIRADERIAQIEDALAEVRGSST
jgi:hypothetical protein